MYPSHPAREHGGGGGGERGSAVSFPHGTRSEPYLVGYTSASFPPPTHTHTHSIAIVIFTVLLIRPRFSFNCAGVPSQWRSQKLLGSKQHFPLWYTSPMAHIPYGTSPLWYTPPTAHVPYGTPPLRHTSPTAHIPYGTHPLWHTSPMAYLYGKLPCGCCFEK